MLGSAAVPAVGSGAAVAAATTLYVNNDAAAHCSDAGSGTAAQPFCHVGAAAAVATAGQTVEIAVSGTYNETTITVAHTGTAEAPIVFRGPPRNPDFPRAPYLSVGSWNAPADGLVIKGQHIRVENVGIETAKGSPGVLVDGGHDVRLTNVGASVRVTNGSTGVVVGQSSLSSVRVDGGSQGTVVTTNTVWGAGVQVTDAPGTVVVSNTLSTDCHEGIAVNGTSTGSTVENNVVDTAKNYPRGACPADPKTTGITVAQAATAGTKVDYNVVSPVSGAPAYSWAGTDYSTRAAFTAASAQGAHDFVADPQAEWKKDPKAPVSPVIDSADENAPGMIDADAWGWPAKDDPLVPNTGTGKGYRDRGAEEFGDFGSLFVPAGPTRLLDTRERIGVPGTTPVPAYGTVDLPVTGIAGVPAKDVTAVTLNVTVTETKDAGHLTVYPHGQDRPTSSNLNWPAGRTIPNLVTVPVVDGKVSFYNASGGTTHVIADLAGYYSSVKGSVFTPKSPTRLLDTREKTAVAAGGTVDLPVTGVAGVPASGVAAVTMNVTVTEPGDAGHLTVYPHGEARPNASNLNWVAGQTIPNLVTVPVKDGKVSFHNASGATVQVIADLAGYYSSEGRNTYWPMVPHRIMDTRADLDDRATGYFRKAGAVPAWGTLDVPLGEMPRPTAVTLNVTVTEPGAEGHLTVYPHGDPRPNASNLNFVAGETIPNQVVVRVNEGDDKISIYNASGAPVHVVVDIFGFQML